MFAGFFQDVFRMIRWILWAWWNVMIISNESMNFKDPKESDDPNYSMIPAAAIRWSPGIRWSPAIGWSSAIRWSPAIRWSIRSMDLDNRKVYGDTSITDGLVSRNLRLKCCRDIIALSNQRLLVANNKEGEIFSRRRIFILVAHKILTETMSEVGGS